MALRVINRGRGVAESEVKNVFERFYRGANSADGHADGSGLGLPMARSIVEAHRGSIELTSRLDEGATVTVILPAMCELRSVDEVRRA